MGEFAKFSVGENFQLSLGQIPSGAASRMHISAGDRCSLVIEGILAMHNQLFITMGNDAHLHISSGQMMGGVVSINLHEPSFIAIGKDCLWANATLQTSDCHSILSVESDERLNKAEDIILGDRVWLAQDALVLKGATVGNDVVIGARSVVASGSYPSNSVLAGVPARVVKTGTYWRHEIV